ncbi:MAG: cbb3-type cytochrome oxidase assembly protein CcoS [Pseudomonadota bacterium]|nr:MAG: cbb3-type cytochrome oxidase assembly protein CcoS [Pseudomonadota bacterium]
MEVVFLLVTLALVLAGVVIWAFFWAIRSGQFDDLEGPAHRILMDDAEPQGEPTSAKAIRPTPAAKHQTPHRPARRD